MQVKKKYIDFDYQLVLGVNKFSLLEDKISCSSLTIPEVPTTLLLIVYQTIEFCLIKTIDCSL